MTKEPTYVENLRRITRADPISETLEAQEREMYASGSDRARAVLFGSLVETNLQRLIASKMRNDLNSADRKQLFEYEGAIGSFGSKILVAYALKFIGPLTRFDLQLIKLLRNEFAHSRMTFDFETPEVQKVCELFRIIKLPDSENPASFLIRERQNGMDWSLDETHPRTRFISACHSIAFRLKVGTVGVGPGDVVYTNDDPLP